METKNQNVLDAETKAVAKVEAAPVLSASETFAEGSKVGDLFSTDNANTIKSEAENINLFSAADSKQLKSAVNVKLIVTKFVAGNVELVNEETGEIEPRTRVVLQTADGKVYSTSSNSAVKQLAQLKALFDKFGLSINEETPLPVTVTQTPTSNGYNALGFEMDADAVDGYIKSSKK